MQSNPMAWHRQLMGEYPELKHRMLATKGHTAVFSLLVKQDFFKAWTLPRLHDYCFDWCVGKDRVG